MEKLPVQLVTLLPWLTCLLASMWQHLLYTHNLQCCPTGTGNEGQLGNGMHDHMTGKYGSSTPVAVSGGHYFSTVCTGFAHSCAVDHAGNAWCWGELGRAGCGVGTFVLELVAEWYRPTMLTVSLMQAPGLTGS